MAKNGIWLWILGFSSLMLNYVLASMWTYLLMPCANIIDPNQVYCTVTLLNSEMLVLFRLYIQHPTCDSVLEEKDTSCCSNSVGVIISVIRNFNFVYNLFTIQTNILKLHTLVNHHKGYNMTKGHNSVRLSEKMRLYRLVNHNN